jgi:hypothetical protein
VGSSRGDETTNGTDQPPPAPLAAETPRAPSTSTQLAARRTLTFPASETRPTQPVPLFDDADDDDAASAIKATLAQLRDSERALDAPGVPKDLIPTQALLPLLHSSLEGDDDGDNDAHAASDSDERPSERSTVPTLNPKAKVVQGGIALESSDPILLNRPSKPTTVELSGSELTTDRELSHAPSPRPIAVRRDRLPSTMPPPLPAQWKWRREVSLHTLLRGQSGTSKAEVLELELEDDVEASYPIELSRVSRPAHADHDHDHDHHHHHDHHNEHDQDQGPSSGKTARPPKDPGQVETKLAKIARILLPFGAARTLPLVASHLVLAATVALIAGSSRTSNAAAIAKERREPRAAASERTPLVSPASDAVPFPLSGACTTSGASRILASRAQIGPGLDVSVLETGFGVALASGSMEATGLRVEGSSRLRVAETVRVKHPGLVNHVAVDGREDDADGIDVRVDSDEARTVVGAGDAAPFRVVARGGYVMALLDDPRGARIRTLWPVPGVKLPAPAPAAPTTAASSPYRPHGLVAAHGSHVFATEVVRASGRDDGGAVVAIRRPST